MVNKHTRQSSQEERPIRYSRTGSKQDYRNFTRSESKDDRPPPKKPKKATGEKQIALLIHYYAGVSYVFYTILAVYAAFYLGYIFGVQSDRKLLLNYKPVRDYMAYNSYSLLTPLLSVVISLVLIYATKTRVRLSDGDFFGVLGVVLFLACITLHDGVGIQRLKKNKIRVLLESKSSEGIEWEKAWSTKPSCLVEIIKEPKLEIPIISDAILDPVDESVPSTVVRRKRILNPFTIAGRSNPDPHNCSGFHSTEPVPRPRIWMQAIQNDLKCCGPYENVERWKKLIEDPKCEVGVTMGCGGPFIDYINNIFNWTEMIMYTEAGLLCATMILFTIHFAVMKKEKVTVTKAFSLLRVTSQTVLHGYEDIHKEHHLQTQHYHQHLHHAAHPYYHRRRVKRRKLQSIIAEHIDIAEPPRLENFVKFPNRDEEYEDLEDLFLARSTGGKTNKIMFPRSDSLEEPDQVDIRQMQQQQQRKRGYSVSKGRGLYHTVAETKLKAQLRASKAVALAAAKLAPAESEVTLVPPPKEPENEDPNAPRKKKRTKSIANWLGFKGKD